MTVSNSVGAWRFQGVRASNRLDEDVVGDDGGGGTDEELDYMIATTVILHDAAEHGNGSDGGPHRPRSSSPSSGDDVDNMILIW